MPIIFFLTGCLLKQSKLPLFTCLKRSAAPACFKYGQLMHIDVFYKTSSGDNMS